MISVIRVSKLFLQEEVPLPKSLNRDRLIAIAGVVAGALALSAFLTLFLLQNDLLPMDIYKIGIGVSAGILGISLLDVAVLSILKGVLPKLMASSFQASPSDKDPEISHEMQGHMERLWKEGRINDFFQEIKQFNKDLGEKKEGENWRNFEELLNRFGIDETTAPKYMQQRKDKLELNRKKWDELHKEHLRQFQKIFFTDEVKLFSRNFRKHGKVKLQGAEEKELHSIVFEPLMDQREMLEESTLSIPELMKVKRTKKKS